MSVNIPLSADINARSFDQVKTYLSDIGRRAGMTEQEIEEMNKTISESGKAGKKASQEVQGGLKGVEGIAKRAGAALVATFSVQLLMRFQQEIFRVTGQFQKMEAVLTNTLGSKSAAKLAMDELVEFAAKTPYEIDKLTESFIKLANRGFIPTMQEMRALGDLASSTGKEFDQLAEAVLDAQTGEFERLKEFGIRASQSGDMVKFTFKGVTTEVQKTDKAIQQYLINLGEVEGVSGSMAAISGTVAGKVSNISDNITSLQKAIGDRQSGVYAASLDWLNEFLRLATLSVQSLTEIRETARQLTMADNLRETNKEVDTLVQKLSERLGTEEAINRAIDLTIQSYKDLSDNIDSDITAGKLWKQVNALEEYREVLLQNARAEKEKNDAELDAANKIAAQKAAEERQRIANLGLIAKIEYEISEAQKARTGANSIAEISLIDARIEKLQKELALVNLIAGGIGVEKLNPFEGIDIRVADSLDKMNKEQKAAFDKSMKQASDWLKQNEDVARRAAMFWEDFKFEVTHSVADTYFNLEELGRQASEREIDRLEAEKNWRLQLAGDDKDQRLLIEEEFQAKQRALKESERNRMIREAIAQRALALFNIVQSTLQASTAALAPPPMGLGPIAGAPVSLGIKVIGALNAAAALTQPLPRFKDGVFNLKGPGTETSDSIPAYLSKGESVVHAAGTRKFSDILKPIVEDKNMTYDKLLNIMLAKVPVKLRGDLMRGNNKPTDDPRMLNELKAIKQAIKNGGGTSVIIDPNGVSVKNRQRTRVIKQTQDFLYG